MHEAKKKDAHVARGACRRRVDRVRPREEHARVALEEPEPVQHRWAVARLAVLEREEIARERLELALRSVVLRARAHREGILVLLQHVVDRVDALERAQRARRGRGRAQQLQQRADRQQRRARHHELALLTERHVPHEGHKIGAVARGHAEQLLRVLRGQDGEERKQLFELLGGRARVEPAEQRRRQRGRDCHVGLVADAARH